MDVSDDNLIEWDVITLNSLERLIGEEYDEKTEEKRDGPRLVPASILEVNIENEEEKEEGKDVPEDNRSCDGSDDDDVRVIETLNGSGLENIQLEYYPHYESSCSSGSDIDVIDEGTLEYSHSNAALNPSLDISLTSSALEQSLNHRPIVATTPEVGSPPVPVPQEMIELPANHRQQGLVLMLIFIFCIILSLVTRPIEIQNNLKKLEIRIIELEAENKGLKDQMLSKVDDDKLLEKQIGALKDENYKLSVFMQDLIDELEKHTIVFKKGEQEVSHQNEIDKLKEQVNILRIDNDELSKQLVRMRYSSALYPRPNNAKVFGKSETKKSWPDINEQENATEMSIEIERIKKMKEKMLSEFAKLSDWKKSVHDLMKRLENHNKKSSDTKSSKPKGQKDKKENRYENVFKDINNQFAEAVNNIPRFNLSDLVKKYMGVDKKKVKSVFDSVGHFFKKAQEKTKDIYDENIKSDLSNFVGSFRKQWHVLRKSYFEYSKKMQQGYNPHKEPASRYNEKGSGETHYERNGQKHERNIPKEEEMSKKTTDIPSPYDQDFIYEPQGQQEVQREKGGESTISRNSWVFERAAHRSEIRENQDEEEEVNWFLKNKKTTETPDYFSMDENDHESDSYEQKDIFSMN